MSKRIYPVIPHKIRKSSFASCPGAYATEQSRSQALMRVLEKDRKNKCKVDTIHFPGNKCYICYTPGRNLACLQSNSTLPMYMTHRFDREDTFKTVLRINKYNSNESVTQWDTFRSILTVLRTNIEICLYVDNGDIDISPCSLLVAKRFTSDRLCCTHNKAFWSTKHLLQLSESRSSPCLIPALFCFQVKQGPRLRGSRPCHSCHRELLYISLAQLRTLRESPDSQDTTPSYQYMYLPYMFLKSQFIRVEVGRGVWRGATHSDLPTDKPNTIQLGQNRAKHGNFITPLLRKSLKCAGTEFPKFALLGKYIQEVYLQEYGSGNYLNLTSCSKATAALQTQSHKACHVTKGRGVFYGYEL